MALPSYLSLVNDVLVRLREPEVGTINENVLSKLVSKFINDAKRQVEDSYNWNALSITLTADTVAGTFNYALTGSGARFKMIEAYNSTTRVFIMPASSSQMTRNFISSEPPTQGAPNYYNFNGVNFNGDTQVDIYPVPDKLYKLYFNMILPQPLLVADSDQMLVPSEPVIALALARSLVERGEDGGLASSEAYALFKNVLSDYIAIESSRHTEEEIWIGT